MGSSELFFMKKPTVLKWQCRINYYFKCALYLEWHCWPRAYFLTSHCVHRAHLRLDKRSHRRPTALRLPCSAEPSELAGGCGESTALKESVGEVGRKWVVPVGSWGCGVFREASDGLAGEHTDVNISPHSSGAATSCQRSHTRSCPFFVRELQRTKDSNKMMMNSFPQLSWWGFGLPCWFCYISGFRKSGSIFHVSLSISFGLQDYYELMTLRRQTSCFFLFLFLCCCFFF